MKRLSSGQFEHLLFAHFLFLRPFPHFLIAPLLFVTLLLVALPSAWASERPELRTELRGSTTAVVYQGEVRPFASFARDVLDNFSGKVSYRCKDGEVDRCPRKMQAAEVVLGIVKNAPQSRDWKLFKVLRSDVSEALHLPPGERYVSYGQLQPARDLLELYASRDDGHAATLEMKRLYENVQLFETLGDSARVKELFTLAEPALAESGPTVRRVNLELAYYFVDPVLGAFVAAFVGVLLSLLNLNFKKTALDRAANGAGLVASVILVLTLAVRFAVTGHPPMANLYEIILWVALLLEAFEVAAFFRCRRRQFSLMVPVAFVAALLLFFARFVLETGDAFRALPAILNSSVFLTLHVFTIAMGFAGMILSGIVAHVALFRFRGREIPRDEPLMSLLYGTLVFGSVLTIVGTLLGGVWADFAWGRFWGFDPKECGALFVILWAMLGLHLRAGRLVTGRGFVLFNAFNVVVTFLCWFGINLLGVGLHSYGFQNGTFTWLLSFVLVDCALILLLNFYFRKHE